MLMLTRQIWRLHPCLQRRCYATQQTMSMALCHLFAQGTCLVFDVDSACLVPFVTAGVSGILPIKNRFDLPMTQDKFPVAPAPNTQTSESMSLLKASYTLLAPLYPERPSVPFQCGEYWSRDMRHCVADLRAETPVLLPRCTHRIVSC